MILPAIIAPVVRGTGQGVQAVKEIRTLGPALQMGWVVATSILIPLGIGILLDRRWGTAPLFILIGALVGILASTIGAVRIASRNIEALGNQRNGGLGPDDEANRKEDKA